MELDTGSAVSVISKKDYDSFFRKLTLKPTSILLKTYTGEKVVPIGVLSVQVEHNKQVDVLDLSVLEKGGAPLWGREWLRKLRLDWSAIKSLHVLSKVPQPTEAELDRILDEAAPVSTRHALFPTPSGLLWRRSWTVWKPRGYFPESTGARGRPLWFLSLRKMAQ